MSRLALPIHVAGTGALVLMAALGSHAQTSRSSGSGGPGVQTFPLTSAKDLDATDVTVEAVEYRGRKAVRVAMVGQQRFNGLTLLKGAEFDDGTIEADVAVKVTTPAGVRNPGFIGIGFRARQDAGHYELFYLRPGDSISPDQLQRNHTVQYASKPDFDFFKLRRPWPSVYEAYADMQPGAWTHVKIEVAGRLARLFINGAAHPVLIVDGLKGEDLGGGVGLWASAGQENYFSNVRITRVPRQPIANSGEADGTWTVTYTTDVGPYSGQLTLHREGGTVTGTASGPLGTSVPVAGTWRNGYVELSFHGIWSGPGANAGEATATLAGWIDGATARGRVSISDRADGVWTATRTP